MAHEEFDSVRQSALAKETRLVDWLRDRQSIAIGYSGGVDSAYLAAVAVATLGAARVLAIIGRSASYPESQWSAALGVAERIGLNVLEADTDELSDPRYAANPTNRCYFCKTELWSKLVPIARARGIAVVADGPARRLHANMGLSRRWPCSSSRKKRFVSDRTHAVSQLGSNRRRRVSHREFRMARRSPLAGSNESNEPSPRCAPREWLAISGCGISAISRASSCRLRNSRDG
jgi:hypothetical protein